MSLKAGEGKSLKGNKSAALGGGVDMKALLAALATAGVTLVNVTLQNMIAFSGMMDDVAIGSIQPSSAIFTSTQVGMPGIGGPFIVYGDKSPDIKYDDNGEIVSMEGGDKMTWVPTTAVLNIEGGLQVRDEARLGNIIIRENQVVAVAPEDGNVEILPESAKGFILLGGNVSQNYKGIVHFDNATEFSVDSDSYGVINTRDNNSLTTERGDIHLITDIKSTVFIKSILHKEFSRKEDVTIDSATNIVTQIVTTQDITSNQTNNVKETTTIDRVIRMIREISQRKTKIDGKFNTITDTTVTTYDPDLDKTEIATGSETTIDSDFRKGDVFERIVDPTTKTHYAIVTTITPHGYLPGDVINISGTNSEPLFDGVWSVSKINSTTEFELPSDAYFVDSSTGMIIIPKIGSIHLSASNFIRSEIGVPFIFGNEGATIDRNPYIEATNTDTLSLSARYIESLDPIVTLKSPGKQFSDSGIAVNYLRDGLNQNGFFGFVNNTENFTWIPTASIVRNEDGSKKVTGERGVMELKGIKLKEITGDPNIALNTPEGGIFFNSQLPINIRPSLAIGDSGSISERDGGLAVSSNKTLILESLTKTVSIPESTSLTFSDSTSITGNGQGGLSIVSTDAPTTFQSDVTIPTDKILKIGAGTITGTGNNLSFSDMENIFLSPQNSIRIPDDVYLQIGDIPSTGFVAKQGTLNATATSHLNLSSGGNTKLDTAGILTMNVGGGLTNLNSTQVKMPSRSELMFSTNSYISTLQDTFSVHSDYPINLDTPGDTNITAKTINLHATDEVTIPDDVPIRFGPNSTISSSSSDAGLHIRDPNGVYVDENLTVSGALTVYGAVTSVTSTHTKLTDPIITLGDSTIAEYVKDRGVEFRYGDGLYGFMGFSQQDSRFYLVREGTNN